MYDWWRFALHLTMHTFYYWKAYEDNLMMMIYAFANLSLNWSKNYVLCGFALQSCKEIYCMRNSCEIVYSSLVIFSFEDYLSVEWDERRIKIVKSDMHTIALHKSIVSVLRTWQRTDTPRMYVWPNDFKKIWISVDWHFVIVIVHKTRQGDFKRRKKTCLRYLD